MRWTDVPVPAVARPLSAWLDATRDQARTEPAALAAIAARARGGVPAGRPLVALRADAFDSAWQHVAGSGVERGGLLLGEVLCAGTDDPRVALVHVRAAVPSRTDDATPLSLRMHAGVWDAARGALLAGEVVVGWYHSHPGIGAFFSDTDRRTQAGFFGQPFSLGWVIDARRREQAWFVGPQSAPLPLDGILPLPPVDGAAAE